MEFGLLGSITSIPTDFEFATAAFVGAGVNDAGGVCVGSPLAPPIRVRRTRCHYDGSRRVGLQCAASGTAFYGCTTRRIGPRGTAPMATPRSPILATTPCVACVHWRVCLSVVSIDPLRHYEVFSCSTNDEPSPKIMGFVTVATGQRSLLLLQRRRGRAARRARRGAEGQDPVSVHPA